MTTVITDIEKIIAYDILTSGLIEVENNYLDARRFDNYQEEGSYEQYDWNLKSGASRGVIIPINDNEVYKLPFNDCAYDYCELEEEIYKLAEEVNLEDAFLPIKRVTSVSQFPIYAEPLAITLEDVLDLDEDEQEQYEMCNPDDMGDGFYYETAETLKATRIRERQDDYDNVLTFWATMVKTYGADFVKKIDTFLEEKDLLEDLHMGNIGFDIKSSMPVLIDYAGFSG